MSKLLAANFSRLFKYKPFKIANMLFVIMGLVLTAPEFFRYKRNILALSYGTSFGNGYPLGEINLYADAKTSFGFIPHIIVSAVIICLFFGKDSGENTARNKIKAGYSQRVIYLSNLIVSISLEIIFYIVFVLSVMIPSFILYVSYFTAGFPVPMFSHTTVENVLSQFIGLGILTVYASVYLLIVMVSDSRKHAVAASMSFSILMIISSSYIEAALYPFENLAAYCGAAANSTDSYELIEEYTSYNEYGSYTEFREIMRGNNLKESKKTICCFADDILPISQTHSIIVDDKPSPRSIRYIIYDFGISGFVTLAGIVLYSRNSLNEVE